VGDGASASRRGRVQHEYGIFGGEDGREVLDVVSQLDVPVISVLHTVLTNPTRHQHHVLAQLCDVSAALVTMTETARQRLIAGWGVHPSRVSVITHGAEHNLADAPEGAPAGEGKGIEWALRALAQLSDVTPFPTYRIVGQTHPRVLERDGEAYRERLIALTETLGLSSSVSFDGHYLPGPALRRIVRFADVVLLPYDSRDQVTSGVLTEAVAAGKPVVSTAFPHAVELLSGGAGLIVPQRDPEALAQALRRVLTEDGLADQMAATSRGLAASLLWPAVAASYIDLGRSLVAVRPRSVA
jgi:glycosyltransferase involved in cell wall biosynthesis